MTIPEEIPDNIDVWNLDYEDIPWNIDNRGPLLIMRKEFPCHNVIIKVTSQYLISDHLIRGSHYNDVLMTTMAFQITQPHGCFNRLFRCRSKKTSKLRVTGLCAGNSPGPVNSPHKVPVTQKMFPFDDVIMVNSLAPWWRGSNYRV